MAIVSRLKFGQHIGSDKSQPQVPKKDADGRVVKDADGNPVMVYPEKKWDKDDRTVDDGGELADRWPERFDKVDTGTGRRAAKVLPPINDTEREELNALRAKFAALGEQPPKPLTAKSPEAASDKQSSDSTSEKISAKSEGASDDLDDMTVAELRDVAHGEDINLHGASSKADIVKAIKAGRKKK